MRSSLVQFSRSPDLIDVVHWCRISWFLSSCKISTRMSCPLCHSVYHSFYDHLSWCSWICASLLFFLAACNEVIWWNNFCCDQTVVLFPNHSALHLFHQGCRHLIIFVGCRKTFKSLATHLAQNAACVSHYMAGKQQISSNKQYPPSLPNESSHLNSNASIILWGLLHMMVHFQSRRVQLLSEAEGNSVHDDNDDDVVHPFEDHFLDAVLVD